MGLTPYFFTASPLMMMEAAAPSVVWEELPAVTDPMAAKTGRSPARPSMVVSLTPSSKVWTKVSRTMVPSGFSTNRSAVVGMISVKYPAFCAAAALAWEAKANSSCNWRLIL
jgi:hypothetical protein